MIHWDDVYKLSPGEFSEDPDKYAEPRLIYSLGSIRKDTRERMFPSPVTGTLARFSGSKTSQHYVGPPNKIIRRTKASDTFLEGLPIANYTTILLSGLFNGVGLYLDTTGPDGLPWVMFHLDIRTKGFTATTPLIWIAEKVLNPKTNKLVTKYRYPQVKPKYWELLRDKKLFVPKIKGVSA